MHRQPHSIAHRKELVDLQDTPITPEERQNLGLAQDANFGSLMRPPFKPLPLRGGLKRTTDKKAMDGAYADFAQVMMFDYLKALEEKAKELETGSSKLARIALQAFEAARQSLKLGNLETDEVISELRRRKRANGALTIQEAELAVKTRIAHHERDLDNCIAHIALIISQVKSPLAPGLTMEKLVACYGCLEKALANLKKPSEERQQLQPFPNGPDFKPILKSIYVFSDEAINLEAIMIDSLVDNTPDEEGNHTFSVTMCDFLDEHFPGETVWDKSKARYNLKEEVCVALRNARLVLEESENSVATQMAAVKHARRTLQDIFSAYRKKQEIWRMRGEEVSALVSNCTVGVD